VAGRVLVAEPVLPLDLARDLLLGLPVTVVRHEGPWPDEHVVGVIIAPETPVSAHDLDRMSDLRVISTCSIGVDHIDLEGSDRHGVWVCNVPDYCVEEVADHSIAMILALLRGLVTLDRSVAEGRWDYRAAGPLLTASGTRLGIVGCGRVGRAVAASAIALAFEVWGSDPLVPAESLAAAGIRPSSLDELLASCGAVSLHASLTSETAGLIGPRELAAMPDGAVLVNVGRAGLVDLDALLSALDSGKLAGAALDVLPREPPSPEDIPRHPRLIVTPHAAWFSPHAESEVWHRGVLAVRDVLEGREPRDPVVRGRA
jgi:D-3-phosphoglycerate dehydrogenase / 2-oxoglutarate reductase